MLNLMCNGNILRIYSPVDFNLHIPANAATFMVVLVLVLALAWVSRYANPGA
jgi:hypothetical protein